MSNLTFHTKCSVCGNSFDPPSIIDLCDPCFDADEPSTDPWYIAELWIVDSEGNQSHCWTAEFKSIESLRSDLLKHHRHNTVGRPRIHRIEPDRTKTFVEELDMRTPEQIAYSQQDLPL